MTVEAGKTGEATATERWESCHSFNELLQTG